VKILILGASGATGKLVVSQLHQKGLSLRLVVRTTAHLADELAHDPSVEIVRGNITEFDPETNRKLVKDCDAVVSCLGHTLNMRGIFGKPRKLVSEALQNICTTLIAEPNHPCKIVLMNTTGNVRPGETSNPVEKIILAILKKILPPQTDNIAAANYLSETIGRQHTALEWVIVRPDTLVNLPAVTPIEVYPSPIRSPLFNAGKTSRINVGHFLAELLTDQALWNKWKYQVPVIYNRQ
jgi:nucleoside-diphosphate-sugar epimerase